MTAMIQYTYRGQCRFGTNSCGTTTSPPDRFVTDCWAARWRWLEVESPDGEIVGEINRHPDDGKRVWWASAPDS